jgi:hypothetical protein
MVALLDALRGRVKQREGNALDTIAAAARAAARGETYDVGAIEKALAETRQTPGDFERAVELARKRLAWLADFEKLASATTKVTKLESTAEAEKAKFEAARRAFMERPTLSTPTFVPPAPCGTREAKPETNSSTRATCPARSARSTAKRWPRKRPPT